MDKYVNIKKITKLNEKEDVYCLKTNNGNFIANGIVVKNCDALRYIVKTHKVNTFDQEAYTRKLEQQARTNNPLGWGWQAY